LETATGAIDQGGAIGSRMTLGTLAMSAREISMGRFDYRDDVGNSYGNAVIFDGDGALAWANSFFKDRLSFGLAADATMELKGGIWWVIPMGSLGAGWHLNDQLNIAFDVTRIDFFMHGLYNPPTAAALGAAYSAKDSSFKVLADFDYPFYDLAALRGGVEWRPFPNFALRGGWRQRLNAPEADLESGPTAGLSASVDRLSLDYAFVSYGPDASHRVALSVKFPERWIRTPPVIIEAQGGTAAAKALFDLGTGLQAKNHLVDALVAFKQCQQADPSFDGIQERIDSLSRQVSAGSDGPNKEAEAVFKRYTKEGLEHFNKGEFKLAIHSFEIALELDKKNVEVVEKIKAAQAQLDSQVSQKMDAADASLTQGDLGSAVAAIHDALKLDPEHPAAKSRLDKLKPRIASEVKRLHRKGIDFYVDDHLDEAIAQWQAALALDPADPDKVGRDLEKAQKLKDLRK
jgi:tetratricopeptide (TPR) repeat protein